MTQYDSKRVGIARQRHPTVIDVPSFKFVNTFDGWTKKDSSYLDVQRLFQISAIDKFKDMIPMMAPVNRKNGLRDHHYSWISYFEHLQRINAPEMRNLQADLFEFLSNYGVLDEWVEMYTVGCCFVLLVLQKLDALPVNYSFPLTILSLCRSGLFALLPCLVMLLDPSDKEDKIDKSLIESNHIRKKLGYFWRMGNYYLECRGSLSFYNPCRDVYWDTFWLTSADHGSGQVRSLRHYLKKATHINDNTKSLIVWTSTYAQPQRARIEKILQVYLEENLVHSFETPIIYYHKYHYIF